MSHRSSPFLFILHVFICGCALCTIPSVKTRGQFATICGSPLPPPGMELRSADLVVNIFLQGIKLKELPTPLNDVVMFYLRKSCVCVCVCVCTRVCVLHHLCGFRAQFTAAVYHLGRFIFFVYGCFVCMDICAQVGSALEGQKRASIPWTSCCELLCMVWKRSY